MDLTDDLFENAKLIITSLIEDYEIKYPLNIFDLCNQMEFETIPYSKYNDHIELFLKHSKDGFSKYHDNRKVWSIYYNEDVEPKERITFTIAHEIGHILLNTHDERLANFFAGYLLAPVVLIIENKLYSEEKIMDYFKVGYKCAKSCLNRVLSRVIHEEPFTDYEKYIIESQK